jgi:FtsP/CotA-like multicopper oxidase with cupredoxin domain
VSPIWNPEFFGNTMVVNGRTWPYLDVEPRRYRFRLLNGCNSRFLILKFDDPGVQVWQIGAEGGFLANPVDINAVNNGMILMGPAERADVLVDFSNAIQSEITLLNLGPDEPFGGGVPGVDFDPADPDTTGQVMQFRLESLASRDLSMNPARLTLPDVRPLGGSSYTRKLSLNEEMSEFFDGPVEALLGTLDGSNNPAALKWMDNITENPALNSTETWELYNFTADAHPIHIHLVQFEVVNRQLLAAEEVDEEEVVTLPATPVGDPIPPEAWESGYKDTVIAYPGQVTRIKAKFDKEGLYVWHCHILEHEDNEMMRPYRIG